MLPQFVVEFLIKAQKSEPEQSAAVAHRGLQMPGAPLPLP
jgi:hypothetical protein